MNADEQHQMRIEAARWLAALHSGEVDPRREAKFLEWQSLSPEHARCIAQLSEKLGLLQSSMLGDLSRQRLHRVLNKPSSCRQFLRGALAIGATAVGVALLGRVGSSGFAWPGDLYTGIAERHDFDLEDGSHLTLNAASRASPRFAVQQRRLVLQTGELLLDVRSHSRS
ncbi:FecR family protein [Pseudomonas carnis]|uniref:FecR family protein n=1 Tax=Pseudomonas carnis TaxID=2487355 RepID=UPI001D356525|nr:DUF4880 domain-containing protein [Pseudomonas carnis]CAH0270273.1 hypothetical protein SRABI08_03600 [Pseudomonas carnis]CAH0284829.1 hypothetical protein SRABI111_04068 [Pseudomonas carnis]CAH0304219.1 hypothetical protein SRABI110_04786 [Pseudomonas carnis]CAH0308877.1 hypothetical protein SRABI64_04701 [Pseudomonas carnis]